MNNGLCKIKAGYREEYESVKACMDDVCLPKKGFARVKQLAGKAFDAVFNDDEADWIDMYGPDA